MKRAWLFLFLFVILLIIPFVQAESYSGFERAVDDVKLFFSFGDSKVITALEIREKEVNSAMENALNGNDDKSDKNLERAWKRLQLIQERVTLNTAEQVKNSSDEVRNEINQEENLTEGFDVYVLEEEKTGLTAEWVIEVNGTKGQNITNKVVINGSEGRVIEIENRIDVIDGEISNWVIENEIAGDEGESDNGLTWEVKTEVANGDNGLKPEVKTYVAGDGTQDNEVAEDGNGAEDATENSPGNTIDDSYDDDSINNGNCGDGVVCEGENNVVEGGAGTEGTNDIAPAVDSNEGD